MVTCLAISSQLTTPSASREGVRPRWRRRPGFTITETAVAAVVLGVLLGLLSQSTGLLKLQVLSAERRAEELAAAQNLLEELAQKPWDEIDGASAEALRLSPQLRQNWPRAHIDATVVDLAGPIAAKRITVFVALEPQKRQKPAPLTTWVYHVTQEAKP
jgi:hypothetical protein